MALVVAVYCYALAFRIYHRQEPLSFFYQAVPAKINILYGNICCEISKPILQSEEFIYELNLFSDKIAFKTC